MASNSFALKGWAVTLIAGIFVLANKDSDKLYFLVAYIPIIMFWGIDTYYLLQERLYRALYEEVRKKQKKEIDFDLKAPFSKYKSDKNCYCSCFFSSTEFWFYFPLAMVSTVIIILTHLY
jgi:hypothetical protein